MSHKANNHYTETVQEYKREILDENFWNQLFNHRPINNDAVEGKE